MIRDFLEQDDVFEDELSVAPSQLIHRRAGMEWRAQTHLCPSLLAAIAPPIRASFFVQRAARARVVGREHDFDVVEL